MQVEHIHLAKLTSTPGADEMSQNPDYSHYIKRVKETRATAVTHDHLEGTSEAQTHHAAKPIASWLNGTPLETNDINEVFTLARDDGAVSQQAVCIVEDISWDWIGRMGVAWGIEPEFFAEYGVSPKGKNPWETLFPKNHRMGATQGPSKYYHVDGVFEHHHLAGDPEAFDMLENDLQRSVHRRRCWVSDSSSYPPSSSTRFSYCRVNASLCKFTNLLLQPLTNPCLDLFLVDPPPLLALYDVSGTNITAIMHDLRYKTSLRVQCPTSCGVFLPQLLKQRVYSLRQTFKSVFRHNWHSNISFVYIPAQMAINRGELLHLMSASLHRTNFITIEREIKTVSFLELPDPSMQTNAKLLTLREVLSELATGTAETSKYVPSHVRQFYEEIYNQPDVGDTLDFHSPVARLAAIKEQVSDLERFLMDSFQLLMSSISVVETQRAGKQAKMSMEQAVRTVRLTQLAFVYIPLTFVTSIFGMNVRELNEPLLPLWVCIVTLFVVAVATAALFGSYKFKPGNLLSNLPSGRDFKTRGLRHTAVLTKGADAIV
jgi:hypothetical protein